MIPKTNSYPTPQQPKTPAEVLRIAYPFVAAMASMASVALFLALIDSFGK